MKSSEKPIHIDSTQKYRENFWFEFTLPGFEYQAAGFHPDNPDLIYVLCKKHIPSQLEVATLYQDHDNDLYMPLEEEDLPKEAKQILDLKRQATNPVKPMSKQATQKPTEESKASGGKTTGPHIEQSSATKKVLDRSLDKDIEELALEQDSDNGISAQEHDDEFSDLLEGGEEEEQKEKKKRLPQIDYIDFEDQEINMLKAEDDFSYTQTESRQYKSVTSKTLTKLEQEGKNLIQLWKFEMGNFTCIKQAPLKAAIADTSFGIVFSPDRKKIFTVVGDSYNICILNADDLSVTAYHDFSQLPEDDPLKSGYKYYFHYVWGSHVLFNQDSQYYLVKPETGETVKVNLPEGITDVSGFVGIGAFGEVTMSCNRDYETDEFYKGTWKGDKFDWRLTGSLNGYYYPKLSPDGTKYYIDIDSRPYIGDTSKKLTLEKNPSILIDDIQYTEIVYPKSTGKAFIQYYNMDNYYKVTELGKGNQAYSIPKTSQVNGRLADITSTQSGMRGLYVQYDTGVLLIDFNKETSKDCEIYSLSNMSNVYNFYPWVFYTRMGHMELCFHSIDNPNIMFNLKRKYPVKIISTRFEANPYYEISMLNQVGDKYIAETLSMRTQGTDFLTSTLYRNPIDRMSVDQAGKMKGFCITSIKNKETLRNETAVLMHMSRSLIAASLDSFNYMQVLPVNRRKREIILTSEGTYWYERGGRQIWFIPQNSLINDKTTHELLVEVPYEIKTFIVQTGITGDSSLFYFAMDYNNTIFRYLSEDKDGKRILNKSEEMYVENQTYPTSNFDYFFTCQSWIYCEGNAHVKQEFGKEQKNAEGMVYQWVPDSLKKGYPKVFKRNFLLNYQTYGGETRIALAPCPNLHRLGNLRGISISQQFLCKDDDRFYYNIESGDSTMLVMYQMNGRIVWRQELKVGSYYSVSPKGRFIMDVKTENDDFKALIYEIVYIKGETEQMEAYEAYMAKRKEEQGDKKKDRTPLLLSRKSFDIVLTREFSIKEQFPGLDAYSFTYYGNMMIDDNANILLSNKEYGSDPKIYINGKLIGPELKINELRFSKDMYRVNGRLSYPYFALFEGDYVYYSKINELTKVWDPLKVIPFDFKGLSLQVNYMMPTLVPHEILIILTSYSVPGVSYVMVWNLVTHTETKFVEVSNVRNIYLGLRSLYGYIHDSIGDYYDEQKEININDGIPNLFFNLYQNFNQAKSYYDGYLYLCMNDTEDRLINEDVWVEYTFVDCLYREVLHRQIEEAKIPGEVNIILEKCVYQILGETIFHQFALDSDYLGQLIEKAIEAPDNFQYLSQLCLRNKTGDTPLHMAIKKEAPKSIELILQGLCHLKGLRLSNVFFPLFPELFKSGVKAFDQFLGNCFFQTKEMATMKKLALKNMEEETLYFSNYSSLVTHELKQKMLANYVIPENLSMEKRPKEVKEGEDAPASGAAGEESKTESKPLVASKSKSGCCKKKAKIANVNTEEEKSDAVAKKEPEVDTKRVEIYACEFDWIFQDEGTVFIKELSESDNLDLFNIPLVKSIIRYKWNFYQKEIVKKIFIPYVIYLVLFIVETTWTFEKKLQENKEWGTWYIIDFAVKIATLGFWCFFAYIEIKQLIFHKRNYFKSFWNLLDFFTVVANIVYIVLDFIPGIKSEVIRPISSIAILFMYAKMFYFMRIFSSTAAIVRMIIEISGDMKIFLLTVLLAIAGFANSFYILALNGEGEPFTGSNFLYAIIYSYRTGLGDFDTDGFGTRDEALIWVVFIINTLIIFVLLLNMLLAIMGDTFDRVQETAESSMLQETCQVIIENDFLFNRAANFRRAKYIFVIQEEKAEQGQQGWEGKIGYLKKYIQEQLSLFKDRIGKVEKSVERQVDQYHKDISSKMEVIKRNVAEAIKNQDIMKELREGKSSEMQ